MRRVAIDYRAQGLTTEQAAAQLSRAAKLRAWPKSGVHAADDRVLWTFDPEAGTVMLYFRGAHPTTQEIS